MDKLIYETIVTSIGGRDGCVRSDDGVLNLKVSKPKATENKDNCTNPEQLFAAGFAACFESALGVAGRKNNVGFTKSSVKSHIKLFDSENGDGFKLALTLKISLPEIANDVAEKIMYEAEKICPYSRATKGNMEVKLELEKR